MRLRANSACSTGTDFSPAGASRPLLLNPIALNSYRCEKCGGEGHAFRATRVVKSKTELGKGNLHAALLVGALSRGPSLTFTLLARQLHQMTRFVDEE